jgi:TorA maturation chaperone TorD
MLSPFSTRLDPPAVRIGWLRMMLRVFRRHDRDGLYREMIAITDRLIADAEREQRGDPGETDSRRS